PGQERGRQSRPGAAARQAPVLDVLWYMVHAMADERAPEDTLQGPGAARMRRAWWFGGTLVVAVGLAAAAVGWNDLRVRRDAGERYLAALVDSHARQVDQQVDSIERALHGLANGLEALKGESATAATVFAREQVSRIGA